MQKSVVLLLIVLFCAPVHALTPVEERIREYCEGLQENPALPIDGRPLAAAPLLAEFYARRGFQPVWSEPERFRDLVNLLWAAATHGLDPEDYHAPLLTVWGEVADDPGRKAARDLLATDALVMFGRHLYAGKVDPARLDPDWNLEQAVHGESPIRLLEQAVAAPSLPGFLVEHLVPNGPFYTGLKVALARYRALEAAGGWPLVPAGPTLEPGERNTRVTALRARLAVTDPQLEPPVEAPDVYDTPLQAAVERFQTQHGLTADGRVGRRTLEALNVSAADRVDQLRVNLERTRWVFRGLESRYLIVNIAGFRAYLMENGAPVWDSRVVVGTPFRKTPVFKARMTYLVLNPTWTVPPTILKEDLLPAVRRDSAYLAKQGMSLLDGTGNPVDPASVDFTRLSAQRFPYLVRQEPGPKNALGRIKFMFPNSHYVYLHDTPSRGLFERSSRTFSSGCIRVEYPLTLAEHLLNDPVNWNAVLLKRRIAEGGTQTVNLRQPVTVFLVYWTAEPAPDGEVNFFNDVYERDAAVLAALRTPYRYVAP